MRSISDLVRTYKFINSPEAPAWSVRFTDAVLLVALVGVGFALASQGHDERANTVAASTLDDGKDGRGAVYVGFDPAAFDAKKAFDAAAPAEALAAWKRENPDARIVSEEPVLERGILVGYRVTYERP
ncbi:MAG TPA: hypothetical protein VM889_02115 [Candidatus Thermoplasmatota archaeon]|nr:hypothetical protein [Candidatus Thermoplasmatota archaeon]